MPSATWDGKQWVVEPKTEKCKNCGKRVLLGSVKRLQDGTYRCIRCTRT